MENEEIKDQKTTEASNDFYTLLPAVFDEIIDYIEKTEQTLDGEWGSSRGLKGLIKDEQMPELYDKLLELRNGR